MHPVLLALATPWGLFRLYSYGILLGISFLFAWHFILYWGGAKEGLRRDWMARCFVVTALAALAGSRLLFIATNPDRFDSPWQWLRLGQGGLVAYGGFLGGFLASWWFWSRKQMSVTVWGDIVAPVLGSGLFFTRIGCYLYGCDFGRILPEGAPAWLRRLGTFPHWHLDALGVYGAPAWTHHVRSYGLPDTAAFSYPVHPTQLYEALVGAALFGLGLAIWNRRRFRGQVLLVLVMAYALWRFFVEGLRDDPQRGALGGLSTSQLISLALLPIAAMAYRNLSRRARQRGGDAAIPIQARERQAPAVG